MGRTQNKPATLQEHGVCPESVNNNVYHIDINDRGQTTTLILESPTKDESGVKLQWKEGERTFALTVASGTTTLEFPKPISEGRDDENVAARSEQRAPLV